MSYQPIQKLGFGMHWGPKGTENSYCGPTFMDADRHIGRCVCESVCVCVCERERERERN